VPIFYAVFVSKTFGKKSPDFQTVNLAQKKRCVQMNRAQRFKD